MKMFFFSSSYGRQIPGEGGRVCRAGGTSALVLKNVGDKVIIRLPSKHDIAIMFYCMVTVGQVSNSGRDDIPWKGVGEKMSAGYRPRTGGTTGRQATMARRSNPRGPYSAMTPIWGLKCVYFLESDV